MSENVGSSIKEFIEQKRKQIMEGLGYWELKAPIELDKRKKPIRFSG